MVRILHYISLSKRRTKRAIISSIFHSYFFEFDWQKKNLNLLHHWQHFSKRLWFHFSIVCGPGTKRTWNSAITNGCGSWSPDWTKILPDSFARTRIKMVKKLRFRCETISTNLTKMISFLNPSNLIFQINFFNLRLVQRVCFENHKMIPGVMWIIHWFIWIFNMFYGVSSISDWICSICQNFFNLGFVLVSFLKFLLLFRT